MNEKITYEHPIARQNRESLQKEVNEHKVNIDYACFVKTPEERAELKKAKLAYKKANR